MQQDLYAQLLKLQSKRKCGNEKKAQELLQISAVHYSESNKLTQNCTYSLAGSRWYFKDLRNMISIKTNTCENWSGIKCGDDEHLLSNGEEAVNCVNVKWVTMPPTRKFWIRKIHGIQIQLQQMEVISTFSFVPQENSPWVSSANYHPLLQYQSYHRIIS